MRGSLDDESSIANDDNVAGDEGWMAAKDSSTSDGIEAHDEDIEPLEEDITQHT